MVSKKWLVLFLICLVTTAITLGGCSSMESRMVTMTKKYPDKPITIIVPYSAGGGVDLVARALAKKAQNRLGQSLIVVNKPGGTGTIGWNELAGANPDGYTIGITSGELFLQPLFVVTKYNYSTALDPVAEITATPFVMAVQTDQPWQSVADLIRYAKQHPGQLKFGHSGVGSIPHIIGEVFSKTTDIIMEQVPFLGGPEEIAALLGGHIQVVLVNPGVVKPYVQSGMVKILAVTSQQRMTDPILADAPTFQEQGIDLFYSSRLGIAIPKEVSAAVKTKLVAGLKAIITDPDFKKDVENIGLQYEYLNSKESEAQWLADGQKLSQEVQATGILERIREQKN